MERRLAVPKIVLPLVMAFSILPAFDLRARAPEGGILVEAPQGIPFNAWRTELEAKGTVLRHAFPPVGGIVVPEERATLPDVESLSPAGTRVYYGSPSGADAERITQTDPGRLLWHAQRSLLGIEGQCEGAVPPGAPLIHDALPPVSPQGEGFDPLVVCSATNLKYSGSEYVLGSVSVNIILPESNGVIDTQTENWDSTRETNVSNEIVAGLNELANLYTRTASLKPTFTYHTYFGRTDTRARTSYEPITRNAAPAFNDCTTGEGLWACQILNNLGYSSFSNYTKAREFNGDARIADGTDWAFTIFVVDSLNDADGMFPDGRFGYAWLGGPWVVMTYDNDGWGISQMNNVTRHEVGHIHYALDEYSSSPCTCVEYSGYEHYQNQNCNKTCPSNVSCVMRDNVAVMCSYSGGMIGWGDSDADTIPDPVDIEPATSLTAYAPDPTTNSTLTYTGTATIQTRTNQNIYNYRCDKNILAIGGVQWRVDGGSWASATPSDGSFNSGVENYTFTTGVLSNATHTIETRAVDELGQTDSTPASDSVTVNAPVSGPPGVPNGVSGVPMKGVKVDSLGAMITVSWDNACAATRYEILYAGGSMLPTAYSGPYPLAGSVCNIGTGPTYSWNQGLAPASDPKRFYWWIVVATDGATVEGPWGKNSGNLERAGTGTGGSSGQCSLTSKSTTNTCGQ